MDGNRGEYICRAARHRFIERPTPLLRCRVVSSMDVERNVVRVAACVLHRGLHDFGRQLRREAFSFRKNRRLRPLDKILWRGHRPRTPFECGREDTLQNELLCIRFRAPFRERGYLEGEYRLRLQLPVARVIRPPIYQRVSGRAMIRDMGNPIVKTWTATIAFSLAGLISVLFYASVSPVLLPHVIFYAVLVVNTFFSVRFFSRIAPENKSQFAIDTVLVILYLALAFSMGYPFTFAFFALCLFIAASSKYPLLLLVIPQTNVLKRKILIDLLGTGTCAAILGATILGYPYEAAWTMAILFTLANVYL